MNYQIYPRDLPRQLSTVRRFSYSFVLLAAMLVGVVGCGTSKPPEGAPQSASDPTIDLGQETGPKDPAAGSTSPTDAAPQDGASPSDSAPGSESPASQPEKN